MQLCIAYRILTDVNCDKQLSPQRILRIYTTILLTIVCELVLP